MEDSLISDASTDSNETGQTIEQTTDQATWQYAEGVPGSGEPPEYFKSDKYANITEQAKAYRELEKRFGSFTGAPKEYEIKLSDELTEKGLEISKEDPLYEEAIKFARESNMSQDGFNNMMNLYAMSKLAETEALSNFKSKEIESLGPRGQERINNIAQWGKANLPDDLYEGFEAMPVNANAVKALEHIIGMTRSAPITSNGTNASSGMISEDDLRKMQFEKDEYGNRRLQTDPEFRAKFKKLSSQVWGDHDHNIVIGK